MSFADSAEARIERLEAPVKQEFCRQSISRTPFLLQAEAAPALDAAAAQEPAAVTSKLSKAAFKKASAPFGRDISLISSFNVKTVHLSY